MEIKSVALLGAGAVGSYIIWGLSKLPDIRFGIIAEGSRAARLRDEGCSINNVTYHPQVWSPQEAKGVDLLIVALKYGALPGALASIREAVGPNTTVMSLMNGVDSEVNYCRRYRQQADSACTDQDCIAPRWQRCALQPGKTIGMFSAKRRHRLRVSVCWRLKRLCAAPISISAIRIALMKKSGASSA